MCKPGKSRARSIEPPSAPMKPLVRSGCAPDRIAWPMPNAAAERGEADHLAEHERRASEDERLRGEDGAPSRHGGERRADHPRGVLRGDHQDAEGSDRDLRKVDAVQTGERRVEAVELARAVLADELPESDADDDGERDGRQRRGDDRPIGRAHRTELGPLRVHEVAEPDGAGRCGAPLDELSCHETRSFTSIAASTAASASE